LQTPYLRSTRLALVAAAFETFLGLGISVLPGEFASPVYATLAPIFPYLSAGLVAGALVLLIVERYRLPAWLSRLLVVLSAAPLLLMTYTTGQHGPRIAPIAYGALSFAILISPWVARPASRRHGEKSLDLFEWTLGLIQVGVSALMLAAPALFSTAAYAAIRPFLPVMVLSGLAGAALLLAPSLGAAALQGEPWTWVRRLAGVVLPFFVMYNALQSGLSMSVTLWATLGLGLLYASGGEPLVYFFGLLIGHWS